MSYGVVFEQTGTGYCAYVPDLPGCVAAGRSLDDTRKLISEAIQFHIEGMQEIGLPIPPPTTYVESVTPALTAA